MNAVSNTKIHRSEIYADMCAYIGEVPTERLCALFGGRRVYLSTVSSNSIVRFLGSDVASRLVEVYGRGYMYIPMAGVRRSPCPVADEEIVKAILSGLSSNMVVDRMCVSRHRVEKVRRLYSLRGKAGNPGYCRSKNYL